MGITTSDVQLIEKALEINPNIKTVCELGSQNLYLDHSEKPPFANQWYESRGIQYRCIDLAGDNNAMQLDLSASFFLVGLPPNGSIFMDEQPNDNPFGTSVAFDLVTDFGTAEHVVKQDQYTTAAFHGGHINSVYPSSEPSEEQIAKGFYNCWVNKHRLTAVGGLMINVNPKTGNWPKHGYSYLDMQFYTDLARAMNYKILLLDEHAAMGNTKNGWNVRCILMKEVDSHFISFDEFSKIKIHRS